MAVAGCRPGILAREGLWQGPPPERALSFVVNVYCSSLPGFVLGIIVKLFHVFSGISKFPTCLHSSLMVLIMLRMPSIIERSSITAQMSRNKQETPDHSLEFGGVEFDWFCVRYDGVVLPCQASPPTWQPDICLGFFGHCWNMYKRSRKAVGTFHHSRKKRPTTNWQFRTFAAALDSICKVYRNDWNLLRKVQGWRHCLELARAFFGNIQRQLRESLPSV